MQARAVSPNGVCIDGSQRFALRSWPTQGNDANSWACGCTGADQYNDGASGGTGAHVAPSSSGF